MSGVAHPPWHAGAPHWPWNVPDVALISVCPLPAPVIDNMLPVRNVVIFQWLDSHSDAGADLLSGRTKAPEQEGRFRKGMDLVQHHRVPEHRRMAGNSYGEAAVHLV